MCFCTPHASVNISNDITGMRFKSCMDNKVFLRVFCVCKQITTNKRSTDFISSVKKKFFHTFMTLLAKTSLAKQCIAIKNQPVYSKGFIAIRNQPVNRKVFIKIRNQLVYSKWFITIRNQPACGQQRVYCN